VNLILYDEHLIFILKPGVTLKKLASMELAEGSNTLVMAFFVTEVQGNYSVILGWD
jgi:hypothetical protein